MPSIEINEKLYTDLKSLADFIKEPIESVIENFLDKDLEALKDNPKDIFEYFLTHEQVIEIIFGP